MSKTLWIIHLKEGAYAGRTWQPVTHSEYDVLAELKVQGYDPEISVSLGEIEPAREEATA